MRLHSRLAKIDPTEIHQCPQRVRTAYRHEYNPKNRTPDHQGKDCCPMSCKLDWSRGGVCAITNILPVPASGKCRRSSKERDATPVSTTLSVRSSTECGSAARTWKLAWP